MSSRRKAACLGLLATLALFAASCGDDSGGNGSPGTPSDTADALTPQTGGVITVGQYSAPPGLDPSRLASGNGTVGGMEHMAIYDVLMSYDASTGNYAPRIAESLDSDADFSTWTLKLRPGVTFTDGTPFDAAAVKYVHDRQVREGNPVGAGLFTTSVATVTVTDPLTVVYELKQPWAGFPYVLAGHNGIIYSPTAHAAAGANFNTTPTQAGAGPFKVKQYTPGEVLELERNPTYWGSPPLLDGIRFVLIAGGTATLDAIKTDTLQAGYVRDPVVVANAEAADLRLITMPQPQGDMLTFNSGQVTCTGGKPENSCAGQADGTKVTAKTATADVRVRRAVTHAVDPTVINERVYQGKATVNSAPFAGAPADPGVPGPKFDPEAAKKLVAEAKAAGWDGKIRVLAASDPINTAWAQAVAPQLQAVGMEVAVDTSGDTAALVNKVITQRDFDIAKFGYGVSDEAAGNYVQLLGVFGTARYGYESAAMNSALAQLRVADTEAKRSDAYRAITEVWNTDAPAMAFAAIPQALVFDPKVHDPQRTSMASILFDKAWLEQ